MNFNVIIGNPPYQYNTNGHGTQATPIYNKFIEKSKDLNPDYLTMIIPSRWYSGGFGLEKFRKEMLSDRRISKLFDFESTSSIFPNVDISGGVCYFLWDKNHKSSCEVINHRNNDQVIKNNRYLNEFNIFVRDNQAIKILRKALKSKEYIENGSLKENVSSLRPFGLPTNYKPKEKGIPCQFIQKYGLKFANKEDYTDKLNLKDKWKVLAPKAPIAGQTDFTKPIKIYHDKNLLILKPNEICTESYIVIGSFESYNEAYNYKKYISTKIIRFLILLTIISQDINKKNYIFVPDFGNYQSMLNDKLLTKIWKISNKEFDYINSRIRD